MDKPLNLPPGTLQAGSQAVRDWHSNNFGESFLATENWQYAITQEGCLESYYTWAFKEAVTLYFQDTSGKQSDPLKQYLREAAQSVARTIAVQGINGECVDLKRQVRGLGDSFHVLSTVDIQMSALRSPSTHFVHRGATRHHVHFLMSAHTHQMERMFKVLRGTPERSAVVVHQKEGLGMLWKFDVPDDRSSSEVAQGLAQFEKQHKCRTGLVLDSRNSLQAYVFQPLRTFQSTSIEQTAQEQLAHLRKLCAG